MSNALHPWLVWWHMVSLLACITIHATHTHHTPHPATPATHTPTYTWNLFGRPGDGYYTQLYIGTPPQKFNILVDTGSSNFAIAGVAQKELDSYFEAKNSSTFEDLGKKVQVDYTQGSWSGRLGKDVVVFPGLERAVTPHLTDIVLITSSHNFYVNNSQWQGIVGLAFPALAKPQGQIHSWLDGVITRNNLTNAFTLQLCGPSTNPGPSSHHGRLTLGSVDGGGECSPASLSCPIRHKWFYEVVVTGLSVGGKDVSVPCVKLNTDKSIVDSGTSNLRLPQEVFREVIGELKSQASIVNPPLPDEFWSGTEEVCWRQSNEMWMQFPNLTVHLATSNHSTISISVGAQSYLRPAPDTTLSGPVTCWVLGIEQSHTGTVLGAVILEGLCVTFNRVEGVITFSESSCGPPVILKQTQDNKDVSACMYNPKRLGALTLASYIMAGILALLSLPLVLAAIRWAYNTAHSLHTNTAIPFVVLDDTNT